ncbi:MAG: RNA methyltransferase [Bacteroidales bacterium]|nr:RNA methyltransferase [Bacteroidales bacterium]
MEKIESLQNQRLKDVVALQSKSALRREKGLFVVEGRREAERALAAGFAIDQLFFCEDIIPQVEVQNLIDAARQVFSLSRAAYSKIAYREGTEGVVAVLECRQLSFAGLPARRDSLVIVLESVEKPGNLGAILRSADASGADAVIVCDPLTDIYNPNVVRASTGAVFTTPVVACSSADAARWLAANGFKIVTAQLQDSKVYYDVDFTGATALVFGTESTGLSDFWRERSDAKIMIPMMGKMDSLNVATSVAILSYEALRQKQILK